jgi:hypothetical protein
MSTCILEHDINWHDASGNYDYGFGVDGYFVMNGNRELVSCSRFLKEPIVDGRGTLELSLRVVMGVPGQSDRYALSLYDEADICLVTCLICRDDGKILFRGKSGEVDSGQVVSFLGGRRFDDTSLHKWYVVESDEHTIKFSDFRFEEGKLSFHLDEQSAVEVPFENEGKSVARVELSTEEVGVGRRLRLGRYTQYESDVMIDEETFRVHWQPAPEPIDGMPDDNVCESKLRPVANKWLEVTTKYGFVTTAIPATARGVFEFDLMMPDVSQEACVILGEFDGTMKGFRKIHTGILVDRITVSPVGGGYVPFDKPILPVNDEVYRFRIAWDRVTNTQQIWVNDEQQILNGEPELEIYGDWSIPKHLARGIDTICLHPGLVGTVRLTSIQKARHDGVLEEVEPLKTFWGRFRVYES